MVPRSLGSKPPSVHVVFKGKNKHLMATFGPLQSKVEITWWPLDGLLVEKKTWWPPGGPLQSNVETTWWTQGF